MNFTDIFIRRPVLASVVSLLILVLGLRSLTALEVRQYPETKDTVVTITTSYPGAGGDLVKAFITAPLQQAVAEAAGIDYLTSTSVQGQSTIEAHMVLNYDPKAAVAEIQAKVTSQRNVLPREAEDPVIDSTTGDATALMYMAFYSKDMDQSQITDYLLRVVQPQLQAVPGVAKAGLIGNKTFAMRVWLDPRRMASLGVTPTDVEAVLLGNNYLAGVGGLKDHSFAVDLSADTDVSRVEDFRNLVLRTDGQTLVRLEDVARIELGAQDYDTTTLYKGIPAIFVETSVPVRNIEALQALSIGDQSVLHLVVSETALARRALEEHGLPFRCREVIEVDVQDEPGNLGRLAEAISAAGINIDSAYLTMERRVVLGVSDVPGAEAIARSLALRG